MSNYLVTGGGRGLGLEFAKQLAALPKTTVSKVFITLRSSPSAALKEIINSSEGRIVVIECEATDAGSVAKAAAELDVQLAGEGLDVLVNNVGMAAATPEGVQAMSGELLAQVFNVNVVSVQLMTAALIPALERGKEKKIVNISTTLGCIAYSERYWGGPVPAYKISKAALNMLTVQWAIDYRKKGFTVIALSPGWLKTDLGSKNADLEVEVGAKASLDIILKSNTEMSGKAWNIHVPGWENVEGPNSYDGAELPW